MSDITCRFFCAFLVPCNRGLKLLARLFAQTGHESRRQCQLLQRETVNSSFTRPHALGIFLGPTSLVEVDRDCVIQEKHINDSLVVRYFRASPVCRHVCFRQKTCLDPSPRCTFAVMSNHLACWENCGERQPRKFENLMIVTCQRKHFRVFCVIFRCFYSCLNNVSGVDNEQSPHSYSLINTLVFENYTCIHMSLDIKWHVIFIIRHMIYWKSLNDI